MRGPQITSTKTWGKPWGKQARDTAGVNPLPFNAWMIVAQNLRPIPVNYIRLAAVSRMFYRIFMSDELWRRVNVYGIDQNIAEHYLSQVYLSYVNDLDCKVNICKFTEGTLQMNSPFSTHLIYFLNGNLYDYFTAALSPDAAAYIDLRYARPPTGPLADRIVAETGSFFLIPEHGTPQKQHVLSALLWGLKLANFPEYLDDRDVVKLAVQLCASALGFASRDLQDDEEIVLAAVSNYPSALRWASERLQATPNVVLAAVQRRGSAIQHAPAFHNIKTEGAEDVIRAAIRQDPSCVYLLETATQGHPVVVEETFNNTAAVQGVSRVLRRKLFSAESSQPWEESPRQRPRLASSAEGAEGAESVAESAAGKESGKEEI